MQDDPFRVAAFSFQSRLLTGTGKYPSLEVARACIRESGSEIVTVAVRRVDLSARGEGSILGVLKDAGVTLLPNTAGCATAKEAVRTARLARELLDTTLVKLEVIGDSETLYPDIPETLEAAKILVAEGFVVMAYTTDDPITARKLEHLGCAAVMPLAAPIGSGLGIQNPYNLEIITRRASVPILVDAGVGTASHAARAMEIGVDGVLMNTAIAGAKDPARMARAMRRAVQAGRDAFLAGRIPQKLFATASSPLEGVIGSEQA